MSERKYEDEFLIVQDDCGCDIFGYCDKLLRCDMCVKCASYGFRSRKDEVTKWQIMEALRSGEIHQNWLDSDHGRF